MAENNNEELSRKVDDLTLTIDRLSKSFEDYISTHPNQSSEVPPVYSTTSSYGKRGVDDSDSKGYTTEQFAVSDGEPFTQDFSCDENEERGNWTGRLDFLLACLGYAVGLGNVWRFPYLVYKNGGAVFFIPYVIMLFFVGMPIFMLELSLGQFTSSGPLTCWGMAPAFKGIGVGMCIVSGLVAIYYNMIIAWSLFYTFASFTSNLPWKKCDSEWASDFCEDYLDTSISSAGLCTSRGFSPADNGVCYNLTGPREDTFGKMQNNTPVAIYDTALAKTFDISAKLPANDYLNGYVLGSYYSDGFDDLGGVRWQLVLCYLLAYVIVAAALIKGVKSSGKVVYFTALFPYLVLIILLIRGVLLEGHRDGVEYYISKVDLDKLKSAEVWKDAAVQIFFSLSASWGGLIALSSYNRFHNDCMRDTLIVTIGNCLTSFFAGFVIFSYLGFLAHQRGVAVEDVTESGVTLAFVVYPAAVLEMPVSTLWAILFFVMLITLGLDSEFALVETVTTGLMDQFPLLRKHKAITIIVTCIIGFLLGLTLTTNGGVYMLQLMDTYSGGWNVLLLALCECLCIAYVYGFMRYREDIYIMIQGSCSGFTWKGFSFWWGINWFLFTPIGVIFVLIFSWIDYSRPTYDTYVYPRNAEALGWLMTIVVIMGLVCTPIILIIINLRKGEPISDLFRPSKEWGPALPKHRRLMATYLSRDQFLVDPRNESNGQFQDDSDVRQKYSNGGYESDKTQM
jgi:solute carrier family 6 amino acid transporter-like protein 5/7/9/14